MRSLSRPVIWMIVGMLLAADVLILLPSLAQCRQGWLQQRLGMAELALSARSRGSPADRLRNAGTTAVRLDIPGQPPDAIGDTAQLAAEPVDLRSESPLAGMGRALGALIDAKTSMLVVQSASALQPSATITAQFDRAPLTAALRTEAFRIAAAALLLSALAGLLLYRALTVLLLRPLQRLSTGIVATANAAAQPMHAASAGMSDSPTAAMASLTRLQSRLRIGQWRQARLGAMAAAIVKTSHDLRGVLSPALLTAERLQMSADPSVKRGGDILVRAVERAADLMKRAVELAREVPLVAPRTRLFLRPLVEDSAERARASRTSLAVENAVSDDIEADADPAGLATVLDLLLRFAGDAGARRARVTAEFEPQELVVIVTDDGPGLSDAQRDSVFVVPAGPEASPEQTARLGPAIARDLMRAQGGDATLLSTSSAGTSFRLTLAGARGSASAANRTADAQR